MGVHRSTSPLYQLGKRRTQ
nr:unnamed protein product [Callosobruchus chinensis]